MDYSAYQIPHQQYAAAVSAAAAAASSSIAGEAPTQVYHQAQPDYYYTPYSSSYHPATASAPAAAAATYYYGHDYGAAASVPAVAEPVIHPPGIDISNLVHAASVANQQNGYYQTVAVEQQPQQQQQQHHGYLHSHLISAPAESGMMMMGVLRGGGGKRGGYGGQTSRGPDRSHFRNRDYGDNRRGGSSFSRGLPFNSAIRSENTSLAAGRGKGRMGSGRGGGRWSAAESGHQLVGCAVCKIDCNSMEILEQHRKGKRHQKNVEKLEQERRRVAAMSSQEMLNSLPERRPELLSMENVTPPLKENDSGIDQFTGVLQSGVGSSEMVQIQQQIAAPKPVSRDRTPLKRPRPGGIDLRRMGPSPMKRPPKGRSLYDPRRGKRPKMSNAPSVASGPPPPKVCTICNITCDTQAVLECHLAGKKHAAKLKRFETQEQTFGPEALKELYISQSQKAIGLAEKRAPLTKEEQAGLLDILLGPSPHGPYGQEGEPSAQSAGERNLESASQQAAVGVPLLENEGGDQLDVGKSMEVEEDTMPAPEYGALPGECAVPGLE